MPRQPIEIECLCGTVDHLVHPWTPKPILDMALSFCHCDTCRHASGVLCMSYYSVQEPTSIELGQLCEYRATDGSTRYFCSTCGCHIFRWTRNSGWEVTTGVMKGPTNREHDGQQEASWEKHIGVAGTRDGGISKWLPEILEIPLRIDMDPRTAFRIEQLQNGNSPALGPAGQGQDDVLMASCDCANIKFYVTRPHEGSTRPHAGYPDLMVPYCEQENRSLICNPRDEKWWLRDDKYLAGTCACRSCRLSSGFEIQTWAFIPRSNIFIQLKDGAGEIVVPLDFTQLPSTYLQAYQSSQGVCRNFCGTCGATIFWHNDGRSDLIDVSVGIFRAPEGARATKWLDWWKARVSFEEETERDRWGNERLRAILLIQGLRRGLRDDFGEDEKDIGNWSLSRVVH